MPCSFQHFNRSYSSQASSAQHTVLVTDQFRTCGSNNSPTVQLTSTFSSTDVPFRNPLEASWDGMGIARYSRNICMRKHLYTQNLENVGISPSPRVASISQFSTQNLGFDHHGKGSDGGAAPGQGVPWWVRGTCCIHLPVEVCWLILA